MIMYSGGCCELSEFMRWLSRIWKSSVEDSVASSGEVADCNNTSVV